MLLCFYSTGSGLLKTPTLQQTFGLAVKMPLETHPISKCRVWIQTSLLIPDTCKTWVELQVSPFWPKAGVTLAHEQTESSFSFSFISSLSLSLKTENSYSDLISPNPLITPLCLEDEGGAYSFLLYFSLLPLRSSGLRPQGILLILYAMLQYATSLSTWKAHLLLMTQYLFQIALLL